MPTEPLFALFIACAIGLVLGVKYIQKQEQAEAWTLAARRLGFTASLGGFFSPPTIEGAIGNLRVSIKNLTVTGDSELLVSGLRGQITLQRHSTFSPTTGLMAGRSTGNAIFDAAVFAHGPEDTVLSLLSDRGVRAAALDAIRDHGAVLENGNLLIRRVSVGSSPAEIERLVHLAGIVTRLGTAIEARLAIPPHKRLAEAVGTLHGPAQCRALELLIDGYPKKARTRKACERVLFRNPDPETRFCAAQHLGSAGIAHLVQLVEDPKDAPAKVRTMALARLLGRVSPRQAAMLVHVGLQDPDAGVRLVAIRGARRPRLVECGSHLATLADRTELGEEEQHAIVETMRALGGEHAERALVTLLAAKAASVRIATATALVRHGTIAAVAPLRAAAAATGLLETALRTTLHEAIAAIQARAPEGRPGQLALTANSESGGALSIADTGGALSLAGR